MSFAGQARAVNYDLHATSGTIVNGNTTSSLYDVTGANVESGTVAGLYSSSVGGDADNGFWVTISFGSNPQPVLDSAFLKASDKYLLWDSTDLLAFNAGTFDSITLYNDAPGGIQNGNDKFHGTSHAGLNGTAGVGRTSITDDVPTSVPDAGSTLVLCGLGLTVLGAVRRRLT